jgi:hypothetical protein
MIMATYSPDVGENAVYDAFQFLSLALSLLLITFITIYNYIRGGYIFASYEKMVKKNLDNCFEKFNHNENGLEWYVVPGHYWLEIRITPIQKKIEVPLFSDENMPVSAKPFLDSSRPNQSQNAMQSSLRSKSFVPKQPVYNNMMQDAQRPALFSNPLSSVHNE